MSFLISYPFPFEISDFLIICDFNQVLTLVLSKLPDDVADLTIDTWRSCFDIITKQNGISRNCTLSCNLVLLNWWLDLGVNDMALLIAAKHFVRRKIVNYCFLDLLESYNKYFFIFDFILDGLLQRIIFNYLQCLNL